MSESGSAVDNSGSTPANDAGNAMRKGIYNQGNTCFLASVLIALSHIHELTTFISKNIGENDFARMYHQSIIQINEGNGFYPAGLMGALHACNENSELFLNNNKQQDASEALMAIMDTFSEQSDCYKGFMTSLFGFDVINILKCGNCKALSDKTESYKTLEVPILGRERDIIPLLRGYFEPEELEIRNAVKCVICEQSRGGTKQLKLASDPEIVILVMKRYRYDCGKFPPSPIKIERFIKFPIEGLSLNPIDTNSPQYGYYYLCSYLCCIYLTTH